MSIKNFKILIGSKKNKNFLNKKWIIQAFLNYIGMHVFGFQNWMAIFQSFTFENIKF
jgi:hypothetical protein